MTASVGASSAPTATPAVPGSADVPDADTVDVTASGGAQSLTDVLSQLVTLMQMIEKKLQMAASAASASAQSDSTVNATGPIQSALPNVGDDPTSTATQTATFPGPMPAIDPYIPPSTDTTVALDNKNAVDPLTKLLTLIQSIEKKITDASNDNLQPVQAAPVATANTDTSLDPTNPSGVENLASTLNLVPKTDLAPVQMPDFSDVEKKIQNLLTSLRSVLVAGEPTDVSANASAGTTATASNSGEATLAVTSDVKAASVTFTDLSNLFSAKANNLSGHTVTTDANAAFSGNTAFAPESGSGDKSADLLGGNDRGDTRGATTMQNTVSNNSTLAGVGDGVASSNPYSFASQLSATRAANGGTTGLPSVAEQVLLQLNRGVKDGNDQMTIQLHPADLGKISIKLDIGSDGKVQGTVVADNPVTLNLLLKDVRGLERALQEAGLRADSGSLQFNLSGQGNTSGQTSNNSASNGSSNNNSFDTSVGVPDVSADSGESWYLTPGRVNFKV